jgi:hypothetical protein
MTMDGASLTKPCRPASLWMRRCATRNPPHPNQAKPASEDIRFAKVLGKGTASQAAEELDLVLDFG